MDVIFFLRPLALGMGLVAVFSFRWAVRGRQFDDLETPPLRVLTDDVDRGSGPAGGLEATETQAPVTYDDDIVRAFSWATVLWGVVGMLIGVCIAFELAVPALNFDMAQLTIGRLRSFVHLRLSNRDAAPKSLRVEVWWPRHGLRAVATGSLLPARSSPRLCDAAEPLGRARSARSQLGVGVRLQRLHADQRPRHFGALLRGRRDERG